MTDAMTSRSTVDTSRPRVSPPAAAPHASRFVEVDGLRLHYLEYGGGDAPPSRPAMLCVHGGAAHAHWFDFIAPYFLDDYRVLALDQRGHGDSQWADPPDYTYARYAADLEAFASRLDLRDFVLVGHSMGGTVALMYAATYPGRVRRLVVVDSTLQMTPERVAALREVGSRRGSRYATQAEFVERFRLRPAGTTAAPEVIRHLAQRSSRRAPDGGWTHKFDRSVYATRETVDGLPCWNAIRIPALLIKAGRSQRITPQVLAEVKSRCPQIELAEVPDADHHVTLDNPDGFAHALRAFLRDAG